MEESNSSEPCLRDIRSTFYFNLIISICGIILISFYMILIIIYLITNLRNSKAKILTYWFDYTIIYAFAIFFVVCYLIQQIIYQILLNNNKCFYCQDNMFACFPVYFFGVLLMIFCGNNVILDIIKGFDLANTMHKISTIQIQELNQLIEAFRALDFNKIINKKYHIKELIILGVIYLIMIAIFGVIFVIEVSSPVNTAINMFFFIFRILHLIVMIFIVVVFKILAMRKKELLENNYYAHNLIMQRIFNTNTAKLAYFSDFLAYKAIVDFIGNFPVLLFLSLKVFRTIPLIVLYICYCIYLFFTAAIFMYVDKSYKAKTHWFLKKMFCLKRINFHFGAKEKAKLFEEFNFDYSNDEERLLKELNVETKSVPDLDSQVNLSLIPDTKDLNHSIDYFITYKLLYLFFKENEPIYTATQKAMEEEGAAFKSLDKPKNIGEQNINQLFDNRISRMSRISKMDQKSLKMQLKFSIDTLMNSLQEREYKQDFKINWFHKQNNEKINAEFNIESLFGSILYDLFPFYQLTIKDMLKSLDPNYNKDLFETFQEAVKLNPNYNEFHTKDCFLFFETYSPPFIEYDKMKQFFISYQTYLLSVIKNVSYTFIPLIIGVYHITYLDYDKIVILYRHPLSIVSTVKLNHWIKYYITESKEASFTSQKHTDIIDMGEIEVKNNITLSIEEFDEVSENLLKDSMFIKELPFQSFPKIILFVGNDSIENLKDKHTNLNQPLFDNENELMTIDDRDNKIFDTALNDSSIIGDNYMSSNRTKEYGSEIESLFEKYYDIRGNEGHFIVKITFASLFKDNCTLNNNEKNLKSKVDPEEYCNYIGQKLLRIIGKPDSLFNREVLSKGDSNKNKADQ